jgi:pyruvate kinase
MARAHRSFRNDRSLTRIVATVGPASASPAMLVRLVRAGVSVFRLNLSHGDTATHARTAAAIRATAARLGVEAGILADLPGPKIRLTAIEGGESIRLRHGDPVRFTRGTAAIDPAARPVTLHVDYARFADDVRPGDRVLIDDGAVQLRVRANRRGTVECTCEVGGPCAMGWTSSRSRSCSAPRTFAACAARWSGARAPAAAACRPSSPRSSARWRWARSTPSPPRPMP